MMHVRGCDCCQCSPRFPCGPAVVRVDERQHLTGAEFAATVRIVKGVNALRGRKRDKVTKAWAPPLTKSEQNARAYMKRKLTGAAT